SGRGTHGDAGRAAAKVHSPLLLHPLATRSRPPCSRFNSVSASCCCCMSLGSPIGRSRVATACRKTWSCVSWSARTAHCAGQYRTRARIPHSPCWSALMKVETFTPANGMKPIGPYSHIAKAGSFIAISGTAGVDAATGDFAGPDAYSPGRQILKSLRSMLQELDSDIHIFSQTHDVC